VAHQGDDQPAPNHQEASLTFKGDRLIFAMRGDPAAVQTVFKLDPGQKPKAIDVTLLDENGAPMGEPMLWAYELDGDGLKICSSSDPRVRPKEVAFKPGSGAKLMVLKRQPARP
jgi:uncharacterized protein (TIGR03067 family)